MAEEKGSLEPKTAFQEGFPIVGIGASAGGLEALEAFFKAMPPESGMGFVLVVHLDPSHNSILSEILQRNTKMPVCQVEDGMSVLPNHLYVIPPNKELTLLHGKLHLLERSGERGKMLSIDSFFKALATDQQSNAVGLILSGTGTDGTLGLKAIKGELGLVMVQDPDTARYTGMPQSALATGQVDFQLPPEDMPKHLIKFTRHRAQNGSPVPLAPDGPDDLALQKVFAILRAKTGHDFSLYKFNTIFRRIERRMNLQQIDDFNRYVHYLQESEREAEILFKELLIGVTGFFRDPAAFQTLQNVHLPPLLENKPDDYIFRVWVPGCSTGEEAYSVAITLNEIIEQAERHIHVQVFGTDLDAEAIKTARSGQYPESIQADVGRERIKRYFQRGEDGQYRVRKKIREMLVFAQQNVIKDPPFTKLDLLCCRNLLIYLGQDLQKKLLPMFHFSLKQDGLLFLGSSETVGLASDLFNPLDKNWKIYRKNPLGKTPNPILVFPRKVVPHIQPDPIVSKTIQRAEELSILQLVEALLKQSNALPCAIINDACEVVYIHGRTGKFLEPAQGKASTNILEMARPGLRVELTRATQEVSLTKQSITCKNLVIHDDGVSLALNLIVKPILEQIDLKGLMMVVFEEISLDDKKGVRQAKTAPSPASKRTLEELERELQHTKFSLKTTLEESQASNEELKSTNEELQSTNEELQSTNEELETSKEELQSLNEESATVNSELQARIDELSRINDDMKNLLDSTAIATIFLDTDRAIRRFTASSKKILPLTVSDLGRPLKDLTSSLVGLDLDNLARMVLDDLGIREEEASSDDGCSYLVRARPYRTTTNVIDGVVLTFEDCTERSRAQIALSESEHMFRLLFELSYDSLALVDSESLKLVQFNRNAHDRLGYSRETFQDVTFDKLGDKKSAGKIRAHLQRVIKTGRDQAQIQVQTQDGKLIKAHFQGKPVLLHEKTYVLSTWKFQAMSP